jgi:hypothetical protein
MLLIHLHKLLRPLHPQHLRLPRRQVKPNRLRRRYRLCRERRLIRLLQ